MSDIFTISFGFSICASGSITSGSINISSSGTASFTHTIANDQTTEGPEILTYRLFSDVLKTRELANESIIINDTSIEDKTYTLSSNSPTITEGDSGTKNLAFTLTLDSTPTSDVTVSYETLTTGTATAGDDFVASSEANPIAEMYGIFSVPARREPS